MCGRENGEVAELKKMLLHIAFKVGGLMSDIEPGLWQLRRGIIISQVNKPSIAKTTNPSQCNQRN